MPRAPSSAHWGARGPAFTQRRSAEEELLHVGRQFRAALFSYQNSTPAGMPRLPKELGDLVRDPRQPALRRHLRRIPVDPITGKAEWGVVRTPDGFIQAVHSLSEARPIKVGNFEVDFAALDESVAYRDWQFGVSATLLRSRDETTNGRSVR